MEELFFVILFNSQLFQYFANRCYIVSVTDVQRTSTEWDASWDVNVAGGRLCMHCEHLWAVDTFNNLSTGMVLVWYVFCLQFKLPLVVWKGCLVHYNCPGAKSQRCIYRYTVEKVELQATWQKFKWCKRPYWSYCITAYWCYWYHHSSSPSVINLQDLSSLAWAVATARAKDSAAVALLRQALIGRVKASHSCCLKEDSQGDLVCLLRLDVYSLPR